MQPVSFYLYDNILQVQILVDPLIKQRNNVVYAKNLKLYKGVDNTFKVQFKNQDQKPVNIIGKDIKFHVLKEGTRSTFITKPMRVIDGAKGIALVVIKEADLFDLRGRMYHYSISVTDGEGNDVVAYADDNYGVRGTIELMDGHYPEFKDSEILSVNATTHVTDGVAPVNNSLHTFQVFFTDYTGDVVVQASMDEVPSSLNATWIDVATTSYVAQTDSVFLLVQGNYTYLRLKTVPTTGTVDRVIYRG